MKFLVVGAGMMGSAAAYDMARQPDVLSVTLADADLKRAREVAARINHIHGDRKVKAIMLDASNEKSTAHAMKGHDATRVAEADLGTVGYSRSGEVFRGIHV